ncbi:hypothetical protein N657DRAFT_650366 [Parathielavia appendiculata]|uniref:Uncharacterized protein n=1 Tax=Parathielavia appendiculata TaxID=2587402 RepID=A0AAN6YZC3_9PEZI|nr:hypothetical protein N657DRAFT_650366 [Parathielavia appendiculata]
MSSIPIAVVVADPEPDVARAIQVSLLPRYDVVHFFKNVDQALFELPLLVKGNLELPDHSGMGSNAERDVPDRKVPKALVVYSDLPDYVLDTVRQSFADKIKVLGVPPECDPQFVMIQLDDML